VTIYRHLFEMAEQDELVADEEFELQVVVYGVSNKCTYNTRTANATKQNPTTTNAELYIEKGFQNKLHQSFALYDLDLTLRHLATNLGLSLSRGTRTLSKCVT
jgi:hypothetical protein